MNLREYQVDDLAFLIKQARGLLLHDPGGGKTAPSCMFIYWVWKTQQGKSMWSMPSHLMGKNRDELLRFSNFKENEVAIIQGTRKQKDAIIADPDVKVFIMTFAEMRAQWRKYQGIACVAIDEAHLGYSTPTSGNTQELWKLMQTVKYFVGCTGSLIKGRLNSAYPMIHICNPRFYGTVKDFMNQHALYDYWGSVCGWRNHEKISRILGQISRRKTFAEIYGDQEIVYFIEHVDMCDEQQAAYDEYAETGMLEFEQMMLEGANEGVNLLRLRQILAHPDSVKIPLERDGDGKILSYLQESLLQEREWTPRDTRLRDHLQDALDAEEPLVIFSSLVPEQERTLKLCEEMGLECALINGTVSAAERARISEDFLAGKIQVVIGSPATCATGWNWPHVNTVIFLSLDYDHDTFIQAYRRAVRGVRKIPLRVILIQYKKSVEQKQDMILDRKSRESALVDPTYEVLNLSEENREKVKNVLVS